MKRTLSLFFALLLCLVLVPLRETRADTTIDNISCGITKPRHKDRPNYIPYIWVGSHCHSADYNNKYFKNDIIWSGPNGAIEVEGEETFVYGEEYSVTIYVTADDGYIFADSPTVTLNGESVEFVKISDTYVRLYGHFVAEPIYLFSDPSIMINYPSVGQKPDYQPTPMYNSYGFGTSHSTGYNANYFKNDVCWKDLTDNTYFSPDGNKTFVAGHQYRVSYYLTPDFGYKFSSEYYPEIYSVAVDPEDEFGEHEHHYTTYELQSDGSGRCEYTFAALPEKPTITAQPSSKTVAAGSTATFKVVATGATGYQWQWSADNGSTWTDSTSATTGYNKDTLQVSATTARNGYKYRCKVTNSSGTTTSSSATLTVGSKPAITTQPKSVTTTAGSTAKFTVAATSATKYQWQWSPDGGSTWNDSTSATTGYNKATLQVSATTARNGYKYRCKVTNSFGTTTSSAATLTVGSKPAITTQPKSVTTTVGSTAKFTVAATGATKYQWQWSPDNGTTWKDSTPATTGYNKATLQVSATTARNGYKYRCKVTNSFGTTTSSAATLTVGSKPVITTQPKSVTTTAGSTAKFTVAASGATSYQWQWSSDGGSTWTNSSSATPGYNKATLEVKAETWRNGYKYRCIITNSIGSTTSAIVTLLVK